MWAMHCPNIQNRLGDWDAYGSNVKRPIARASAKLGGVVRVFERVLRHTDHRNLAIERLVEMRSKSGTAISIQPNVAVDDDASRWLVQFRQHRLNARQLSTIEFAWLIFLYLMGHRHMFGDWDRSAPIVNHNARSCRGTIRVAYIDTSNRLGFRRVLHFLASIISAKRPRQELNLIYDLHAIAERSSESTSRAVRHTPRTKNRRTDERVTGLLESIARSASIMNRAFLNPFRSD